MRCLTGSKRVNSYNCEVSLPAVFTCTSMKAEESFRYLTGCRSVTANSEQSLSESNRHAEIKLIVTYKSLWDLFLIKVPTFSAVFPFHSVRFAFTSTLSNVPNLLSDQRRRGGGKKIKTEIHTCFIGLLTGEELEPRDNFFHL